MHLQLPGHSAACVLLKPSMASSQTQPAALRTFAPGSSAGSRASAFCPLTAIMPYMLTLPMSCRGKEDEQQQGCQFS